MMRLLVCIAAILCLGQAISDEAVYQQWQEFQVKFEKTYKSPIENRLRLNIFKNNLAKIVDHNALYEKGLETYEMGVNKFADWTSEEFMQYVNKYQWQPILAEEELLPLNTTTKAPASIDWTKLNAVREVKNQGQCGSCWSFSAVGAIEGQLALTKDIHVSLSEQNLIDCAGKVYNCAGCSGGTVEGALLYVAQNGITTERNYPYKAKEGTCKPSPTYSYKIHSYSKVVSNEANLKNTVGTQGPVAVAMEATTKLQLYKSGIFFDGSCSGKLNHGVLAVGYGEEDGAAYWLVKNSWGASWGDHGYFKLARNRGNNCGIDKQAIIPIIKN